ncbi:unnamed protein product [Rhizoctonia solani]|uniref:Protein F37C4,5 [Caenorhabditis elegans] n=1 Tax=Rhizoctonia solani TaxID=456999 RepID=A0A8H3D4I5_9AGAM|nr:unnamed protein product [Rhizoctonia solani]
MASDQPSNRINVNAADQDDYIDSVTVFQSKRAEVKRIVNVKLKTGQNHIHIERLPSCIEEDSIRVDGTGVAIIFDVVYHKPEFTSDKVQETTATAQRKVEALQKERDVSREQADFLSTYGRSLDSKNLTADAVQQFLDMFGSRQIAIGKRIQELDVQIAAAEEDLRRVQNETFADTLGQKRAAKITVTVLAETDGPAELVLRYAVSDASWTPLYDVRTSISNTPGESSTVALHYRASITQSTGENWSDVSLTLSTASPQLGSGVPNLGCWAIGPPPSRRTYSKSAGFGFSFGGGGHKRRLSAYVPDMGIRQAHVSHAGILSTSFGIPGRSNIPSDGGSHKAVITVLDLKAELEWICVPRENECVFLRSKVVNTSEFTLLPGEASVFMDDNFVSKSQIEFVSPNESFKASLGVDSALRVTYPPATILNRTSQSGLGFLSKNKQSVRSQSQRIVIRNTRMTPVSSLQVLDHIPVSTDARFKVNLLSPLRLESAEPGKEYPWTNVRNGVKARWAPRSVGADGVIEWDCKIAPTGEVELELASGWRLANSLEILLDN